MPTKSMSAELEAHYAGRARTIAKMVKLTRVKDGAVFTFTNHDRRIKYEDVWYNTTSSFDPSAIDIKSEMNVDNWEITGILHPDGINEEEVTQNLWEGATLEAFEVNYRDLSMGKNILTGATIGEIKLNGLQFTAEIRGLAFGLQNIIGEQVQPRCNAKLGDVRCGIVLDPTWTRTVLITAVESARVFTTALDEVDDWATFGIATFTSGGNTNLRMEIKEQTADGVITLQLEMAKMPEVGDELEITAGCNHLHHVEIDELGYSTGTVTGDCKNKFNNVGRFRGISMLPTQKAVTQFGGQE